jgi:hypothetical protein
MSKSEIPTNPDDATCPTDNSEIDAPSSLINSLDVDVLDNSVLVNRIVGVAIGKIEEAFTAEDHAHNIRARIVANVAGDVRAELRDFKYRDPSGSKRISYEDIVMGINSEFFGASLREILKDRLDGGFGYEPNTCFFEFAARAHDPNFDCS